MGTLVYRYGALPPVVGAERVDDQIGKAHRYYNQLIEIEHQRRHAYRWLRYEQDGSAVFEEDVERLEADLEQELAAARHQKMLTSSKVAPKENRDRIRDLKKELRARKLVRSRARKIAALGMSWPLIALESVARERRREARRTCGLYWGTYLLIEASIDQAKKRIRDPRFRRWNGTGSIGVQIQKKDKALPIAGLLGCQDSRAQLDMTLQPIPNRIRTVRGRVGKPRPRFRIRVGSESRKPVWAEFPLILHRPLPPEAKITWIKVLRDCSAGRDRWSVHITLETPHKPPAPVATNGAVAVDLGWRYCFPASLRVGYLHTSTGVSEEILVPERFLSGMAKVRDLRSLRDVKRLALLVWFKDWLSTHEHPDWMREQVKYIHAWGRSSRQLLALLRVWKEQRWDGDHEAYEQLVAWREEDWQLWQWETHLREQALAHRREQYRLLGIRLSTQYRSLVLERLDLRAFQSQRPLESEKEDSGASRSQRTLAAPSELRNCLIAAFAKRGGVVEEHPAAYTSRRCHICSYCGPWDDASEVQHKCGGCGQEWDRDENACHNLLALHERLRDSATPGTARVNDYSVLRPKRVSKWGKKGRHKSDVTDLSQMPIEDTAIAI